ncbi:hypothetical protein X805_40300 [Sphaerotilus natans subsp. natans DSM 6575]|uniref:Uncharacterized protein n=1 Tax=Sphaerotilus natans subsp. natans DSM 6575 TaxID=1286631 RepID=A0A059KG65_9BURK|nr:hypothetical protein X805_40300 [Sphaerotilus natans subsp. natans DSM 6575]
MHRSAGLAAPGEPQSCPDAYRCCSSGSAVAAAISPGAGPA